MRLTDLWKPGGRPTVSFELFPARNDKAEARLAKVLDALAALEPDFVSVTFGAGGSTRDGSRELVRSLARDRGLEVLAYFACYGLGPEDIDSVLGDYRDLGVDNVLAVRGDPPRDDESFVPHPEALAHASDLVEHVRARFDFCIGCAGYPEGHVEAESLERDLEHLALKVRLGAEYVVANYFYDNRYYFDFVARARAAGIDVPILPGVMPIFNVKTMEMLASLCGATITDEIRAGLASLPEGDKDALNAWGVELAVRQCRGLLEAGAPGVHLYTMDRASSVVPIVERLRADGVL